MSERTNRNRYVPEEAHYQLLQLLEHEPQLSQREIAERLGVSLGKVNYCVQALAARGLVKMSNFYRSQNKRAYLYTLTPRGIAEKTTMALRFLRIKEAEHRNLMLEIEALRKEVGASGSSITDGNA